MLVTNAELNYYPEEIYDIPNESNKKSKKTRKNKKKSKSNVAIKTLFLFSGLIIMGISLFILFRYANITRTRMELDKLEKQMIKLEKTKLDLVAELEGIKSSQYIVDEATNKLGMSYPKEGQIVYVSVNNTDDNLGIEGDQESKKIFSLISSLF